MNEMSPPENGQAAGSGAPLSGRPPMAPATAPEPGPGAQAGPESMFEFAPERPQPTPPPGGATPLPAPVYVPPAASKPRTDVAFFLLGLFTLFVLGWVLALMGGLPGVVGLVAAAFPGSFIVLFVVFLVTMLAGRANGNVRLASYGKGGLWAFGVVALLLLVAFGTCLVQLQGARF